LFIFTGARKAWPQGCTSTSTVDVIGNTITWYYDIKPLSGGRITLAIYKDSQCTEEYSSDAQVVQSFLGNPFANVEAGKSQDNNNYYDFSSETLAESLQRWESAFSEWTYCHPCVAYDVQNIDGTKYTADNNYYYNDGRERHLGGNYEAQGDIFECYDDAGYTNVNQVSRQQIHPVSEKIKLIEIGKLFIDLSFVTFVRPK
jgi:hypothetical protein